MNDIEDDSLVGIIAGGERYISIPEAEKIWKVSRRTLYNWMNRELVIFAYAPGGSRYIKLSSMALRLPSGERVEVEAPKGPYEFLDVRPLSS